MAKRTKSTSQHLGGNKGTLLAERLHSADLGKVLIVPIEIGKSDHKACIADYFGSILTAPFVFHSSQEGMCFLDKTISKVSTTHQAEQVFVAMEATGHYYRKPAASLYEMGYTNLFILNPLSTAQGRKAGLTWSKTDDLDLRAVGQALLSGYGTPYRPEQSIWQDLREIGRYRRFQVRHQTALKNKIHAMLDHLLPGITELEMFKDPHLWHPASLKFFTRYPTVDRVAGLRPRYIVGFFRRHGRRLSSEDGHHLIRWTQQAFPQEAPANATREQIFTSLVEELTQLSEKIGHLEVTLLGYLVRIPAVVLLSMDYVGPIRAGEFAGELTPFEQYPTSRALIKGAGLDPTTSQSATRESPDHPISRKGSKALRYISVHIGDALMKRNDYFAPFAHRLIQRGKSRDCACVATATRFMRVAFRMIQEEEPFHPSNGMGVSKDPLAKIELFLSTHQASA